MPEIFNPVDDLIAEQALVDALVADFTEDDWNRMASYCTTWTFKDVICHIAFFDYCAVELLAGRGESVNAVADAASEQDEHCHVMAFRDQSGADILNWWREQRTLMTASFLELGPKGRVPWAAGIPPMSVRSLASARLMELWAHSVDLYDALGIDPVVKERITSTLFRRASCGRRASRTIRTTSRARRRIGRSWPSAAATGWTPASKWSATRRAPTRASCRPTPAPPIPRRKRRTRARSFAKPS